MEQQTWLTRIALRCCDWSERWFPDAYVFAALGVIVVGLLAVVSGVSPAATAYAFGDGFWSLIPFTMQMCFIIIGGYVVASSPPVARIIEMLAQLPRSGRGAVAFVALVSTLVSLLHWGLSLIFGGLLVRALARREELRMDYRAAGAAAYLGLGAVWALGLSSSAAQLQANPGSMTPALLATTGVIPFTETIFLPQSLLLAAILVVESVGITWLSAPTGPTARTADALDVGPRVVQTRLPPRTRPGDWLERSPLLNLLLLVLGAGWLIHEISDKGLALAISSLNTYNFLFLTLGLLLNWNPRRFLDAVARAVPSATGVLIQFPLYGGIASILTSAKAADGHSLAQQLAAFFTHIATAGSFPVVMGVYSAVLGFFVPSGGGKWLIEAPYLMQSDVPPQGIMFDNLDGHRSYKPLQFFGQSKLAVALYAKELLHRLRARRIAVNSLHPGATRGTGLYRTSRCRSGWRSWRRSCSRNQQARERRHKCFLRALLEWRESPVSIGRTAK